MERLERFEPFAFVRELASRWDAIAIIVVLGLLAFFAEASRGLLEPLAHLQATPLSLSPAVLPVYAARTTLRMFVAMALSLLFTFAYGTWAAKSPRAERILVPILDILQSVPILGFLSVTVVFFLSLVPGRVLGAEFAAIFAIFTSQAWNMAFSFYQSLRTVPDELREAADSFHLTPWMRFWRLEAPFAMPALLWNMMMSMSGSWFFVVASEAISVGHTNIALPGVGSYIALAIRQRSLGAIGWAIATMLIVILAYDQLIFRPLIVWGDRFRIDQEQGGQVPDSWALTMMRRSRLIGAVTALFNSLVRRFNRRALPAAASTASETLSRTAGRTDALWFTLLMLLVALAAWRIARSLIGETTTQQTLQVLGLACVTLLRVVVLIALASIVWVPVGVWVGLRPRAAAIVQPVAQFLAAFPSNLLFPVVVFGIVTFRLNPDLWLSPLMILGTQWYILFNVIAGASAMPVELRYASENLGVRGRLWWRKVALPGVLPYYVTGAITASGGAWNASVVAEVVNWGNTQLHARGLGAYIADATTAGDFHRVLLGITTMSLFVVIVNRAFWRPLYYYAERKYRLT
ncbi:MAG TPA: ABC transporter permease subunit [Steroidobacteraceae bacterium]|nr:ABC transporter permease subunit [Steroidobacteraceae bacterium]